MVTMMMTTMLCDFQAGTIDSKSPLEEAMERNKVTKFWVFIVVES